MLRTRKGRKEKESKRRERRPKASQTLGKFGKWLFSPFATGAELAVCQCCSRGTAEKDGGDGEDAAGSAGERRQMGGLDSTMVEAAKREKTGLKLRKRQQLLRCALLNGSAWSTWRKYEDTKENAISSLVSGTE